MFQACLHCKSGAHTIRYPPRSPRWVDGVPLAMQQPTTLEAALRRDRFIVILGLIAVAALAWAYMFYLAWNMKGMEMGAEMAMSQMRTWGPLDLVLLFVMWSVMMVAMMVPSASPLMLLFARINRQRREREDPVVPTAVFLLGYLLVWTGFSALATLAQWGLHSAALLSPMMVSTSSRGPQVVICDMAISAPMSMPFMPQAR